jgi:hypothetical protein
MIRLKTGVNPIGVRPEVLLIIMIADQVYTEYKHACIVTSINDSTHSDTSRHYQGMAVDFRTKHLPNDAIAREIAEELRKRLGRHYLVLFEHNHIHVSYKPRKP